ncbi:MAG: methyltransferase domain-containing protein [Ideonella sp.]|nr:methyltransferase domain-containing protein [Ideonella sp.]MCC7459603.1 methyltransferase domain-containing protein [Nitrospira sp.]
MDKARSQQFMLKLVGDVGTVLAAGALIVGDRAGLFHVMAGAGALSPEALAARSGVAARCVEEWLAVMTGAGYVEHDAASGTFTLPAEHALFLTDPSSEYYLGGLFHGMPAMMASLPQVAQAYQRGQGVRFADFSAELPLALEAMNRSVYENRLVSHWLPAVPEALARLQRGGRAIDVGCGTGVVPITLAKAFASATIAGLDFDMRSLEIARSHARAAGVDGRIEFIHAGVEALPGEPGWDLITSFDVVHDLPDPLVALRRIRGALADGGTYLMVEPKVAERLQDNIANPFARMLYGMSCLHCVPQSLAQGGPGLGACWGEARARALADEAGFGAFERLDVRSPAMAFYALRAA